MWPAEVHARAVRLHASASYRSAARKRKFDDGRALERCLPPQAFFFSEPEANKARAAAAQALEEVLSKHTFEASVLNAALHAAAEKKCAQCVELLLRSGADANSYEERNRRNALLSAAHFARSDRGDGSYGVFRHLLEHGAIDGFILQHHLGETHAALASFQRARREMEVGAAYRVRMLQNTAAGVGVAQEMTVDAGDFGEDVWAVVRRKFVTTEQPMAVLLAHDREDRLVGFLLFAALQGDAKWYAFSVQNIVVARLQRRSGVGRALVEHMQRVATTLPVLHGRASVKIAFALMHAPGSADFWKSMGFSEEMPEEEVRQMAWYKRRMHALDAYTMFKVL